MPNNAATGAITGDKSLGFPAAASSKSAQWLPSVIQTQDPVESLEASAPVEEHVNTSKDHFPPWRNALEHALKDNERPDSAHLYASLATIKPFGRPSNRSVFFRGFLSDGIVVHTNDESTNHLHKHQAVKQALSPTNIERLCNVMVFAIDVRSGSVDDLVHGSRFGEICWLFPESREQFRLSGQLHLIASPQHPLCTSHQIPRPFASSNHFPHLDWEKTRLDVWRQISAVRRASFTWPTTHHDVSRTGGSGFHSSYPHTHQIPPATLVGGAIATVLPIPKQPQLVTSLDAYASGDSDNSSPTLQSLGNKDSVITTETELKNLEIDKTPHTHSRHHGHHQRQEHHDIAFNNFCLLLLDVDGADHLQMSKIPHSRTKFRKTIDPIDNLSSDGSDLCEGVECVSTQETFFSIDDLMKGSGGARASVGQERKGSLGGSTEGLVKKVAHWVIKDVLA